MAMPKYNPETFEHLQNVASTIIYGNKDFWSSKIPLSSARLPEISEDLKSRVDALDALEKEVRRLYLSGDQEPVLIDYIRAVREIPTSMRLEIDGYDRQTLSQRSLSENRLSRGTKQNPHKHYAQLYLIVAGANDVAYSLWEHVATETGAQTRQELNSKGINKVKEWVDCVDSHRRIQEKSAFEISFGYWATFEMAEKILSYGDYTLSLGNVIGVPTGHPKAWKYVKDQLSMLEAYSKQIHREVDENKWSRDLSASERRRIAVGRLCGPAMSVMALRKLINDRLMPEEAVKMEAEKAKKEFESIDMRLQNIKRAMNLYDLS